MKGVRKESDIIEMLVDAYGEFTSYVEQSYLNKIVNILTTSNDRNTVRFWLIINEVMSIFKNLNMVDVAKEMQYIVTNENYSKLEIILLIDYNNFNNDEELIRLRDKLYKLCN